MSRLIWLLSKASPVGIMFVFVFVGFALVDCFTHVQNAIARWLLASFFVLYWPDFVCSSMQRDSESKDDDYLLFTGCIGFVAVSVGCVYDHFFPHFAQHRVFGDVPDYPGLKWAMGASLLFGYFMAITTASRRATSER